MTTFTDMAFYLQLLYFIPVIFLAFYIPGNLILRSYRFTPLKMVTLSFILGIVLWALQGIIFGYLHLRWLSYLYVAVTLLVWVKNGGIPRLPRKLPKKIPCDPLLLVMIFLGVTVQLITIWFIGYQTSGGLTFCCFWPDSFYHLALVRELTTTFPPMEPGMSGVLVRNYHYLANLVVADLVRVFRLSLIPTQNQFMPLALSFLLAGAVTVTGQMLSKKQEFTRWLVFFIFFSGDIIFLLTALLGQGIRFDITVSENATTLWFSPPRMFALVILFGVFTLYLTWIKEKNVKLAILIGVLSGSLVGFKIYLGFFAFAGLGFVSLLFLFKRDWRGLLPMLVGGVVAAFLYLPVNTGAGGLFFSGLWRFDNYAVRPELGLLSFTLAKQVYAEHHNVLRVLLIELLFFGLYAISLFGMFSLGFFQTKHSLKQFPRLFHVLILGGLIVCLIIGMFFLQNTGGANTLQFLFSVYIVGSLYTALALTHWLGKVKKPYVWLLIVCVVILTGFRVVRETYMNIADLQHQAGFFTISTDEQRVLGFIQKTVPKNSVIAVSPDEADLDECYARRVVTDRSYFLCGSGILEDHGLPVEERRKAEQVIFTHKDSSEVVAELKKHHIEYLYVPSTFLFGTTQMRDYTTSVYNDEKYQVYRIDKEKLPAE